MFRPKIECLNAISKACSFPQLDQEVILLFPFSQAPTREKDRMSKNAQTRRSARARERWTGPGTFAVCVGNFSAAAAPAFAAAAVAIADATAADAPAAAAAFRENSPTHFTEGYVITPASDYKTKPVKNNPARAAYQKALPWPPDHGQRCIFRATG